MQLPSYEDRKSFSILDGNKMSSPQAGLENEKEFLGLSPESQGQATASGSASSQGPGGIGASDPFSSPGSSTFPQTPTPVCLCHMEAVTRPPPPAQAQGSVTLCSTSMMSLLL